MRAAAPKAISFGRRIPTLAEEHPDKAAAILVAASGSEERLTYGELDRRSNALGRLLATHGVEPGSMVAIALPTSLEHVLLTIASWKLGACVLPLNPHAPPREMDEIISAASPRLVVGKPKSAPGAVAAFDPAELANHSDDPLPERVPDPGKAIVSGGSTGRPKLIIDPGPWKKVPGRSHGERGRRCGFRPGQTQLLMTRLYHNMPFNWTYSGLFDGQTVVMMEEFDPVQAFELIDRHRVNWMQFVPIIMKRMAEAAAVRRPDVSSVQAVLHAGAPCPQWVKRWWIELLGPERVWELYGFAENVGLTMIRGDEWLSRPGSVGRPVDSDLAILDDGLRPLATGAVGEVFMRPHYTERPFYYLGSPPPTTTPDGLVSMGDLGWVDEEGYLFLADRRVDLIITGGANVYPAEVEAALSEHPDVADLAVIPIPDDEWGQRVHAVIQLKPGAAEPSVENLDRFCRERIAPFKRPKSYEFVEELPREPTGKIRRSALAAVRREAEAGQRGG